MVSWTIKPRNNRAKRTVWFVNLGKPIERGTRVFLKGSKNSLVALSIMCWEYTDSMRVHVSLTIALVGL